MPKHQTPRHPGIDDPDDAPPPARQPIDPDQGPVPPSIPEDPEHDRVVDPEA